MKGRGRNKRYNQGFYKPRNPEKYIGDVRNVEYLSSWEKKAFIYCDTNPLIVKWASEEPKAGMVIPYVSPVDGNIHRYFIDICIKTKQKDGSLKTFMIEIKPFKETLPPVMKKGKRKATMIREVKTYTVNQAKWDAARKYCAKKGYTFMIWTEKELYNKK